MSLAKETARRGLPILAAGIPMLILMLIVLTLPLAAARQLGLSAAQTAIWIVGLYGLPGVLSLVFARIFRQPLQFTGNLFVLIFITSLGSQLSYAELVGASMVAGVCLALVGALGLTGLLAAWLPAPIVLGLLAGAIMPYLAGMFTNLGQSPLLVGGALLAYLASRMVWGERLPPILPALAVGLALAALTGQMGPAPRGFALPVPVVTWPVFSLQAVVTAVPVMVALMTVQANLPSLVYLRSQGYQAPERAINLASGFGTVLGSLIGPVSISISMPATALVAGPEAGEPAGRHHVIYFTGAAGVTVALLAAVAAELAAWVPLALLLTLTGLALLGVLAGALKQITQGPLVLGPLFAFVVALSDISLFGFGPFFWSLVIGLGVSLLLERRAWRALREAGGG